MRRPLAFGYFHIGEGGFKGRFLGTASVNSKSYRALRFKNMAYSHLLEVYSIKGIFNAKIVVSSA
jgi:hypothetical protein